MMYVLKICVQNILYLYLYILKRSYIGGGCGWFIGMCVCLRESMGFLPLAVNVLLLVCLFFLFNVHEYIYTIHILYTVIFIRKA